MFADHVIDEHSERRLTRAEQRVATRTAILDAAGRCLIEDGYAALTTRRIAERANVAQSTLMHHFPAREGLIVETVQHLASGLADTALEEVDFAAARDPEQREVLLDHVWRVFTTPEALAAAQLWFAAWDEPELAAALRDLEERLSALFVATAGAVLPELVEHPSFPALVDSSLSLIRGLVMAIPVSGREAVDARWQSMRPLLAQMAGNLLDDDDAGGAGGRRAA
jgi:AcrR family transcriptional regulator